ncbi:hypothetical protein DASC09_002390 [Saccharomycopsis crataegensis]|uniref:Peptidase A1 domain-containing protein n=1 Tax=Saccharomycopsis crataegensis TaxID=43959 RepID=A0AAV5QE07_9ASCO|nr:hypothetical protein DASC09_002390 [Saccharomycopsis crataegensis]
MIYTTKVALSLLAALATITEAAPVSKKSKVAPVAIDFKVIKENTFKKYSKDTKLPKSQGYRLIENYQNTHSITIPNEGSYFLAQLKIGSDDQELGVIVDTGSSDLWFPSKSSCEPSKTVEHDSTLSGLPAESSSCPLAYYALFIFNNTLPDIFCTV